MGDCGGSERLLQLSSADDLTRCRMRALKVYDFGEFQTNIERKRWPVNGKTQFQVSRFVALGILASLGTSPALRGAPVTGVVPAKMPRVGTIDERFQSFNIEMLEVTGGRFWAPYKQQGEAPAAPADPKISTPPGMDPSLYRYRPPLDLSNPRLRKLAAGLAPSYVRVSGTWANSTYFQDSDDPAPSTPPAGFGGVLTRQEWRGVVDFSHAVDAKIVTSFAVSPGVRDANGVWTPVEAKKFLAYTHQIGGSIAAAEMFNEPSFASMGGAPKGYDAAVYGLDFKVFHPFIKTAAPEMVILGPGSVGESGILMGGLPGVPMIRSEEMLTASGPGIDVFSYHFYGGVSKRCTRMGSASQATPEAALSVEWLSRTDRDEAYYAALRDRFLPGGAIWLTETGETACGGNPWAPDFIDSFRYLNQLGTLAKRGIQVVMHNTLAASDYALVDETTLLPRPNYWSALLWHKVMGTTVLDAGASPSPNLHLYAHCLRNQPGGVALLAINADRAASQELDLPTASERYTLTAKELMDNKVELNGSELRLGSNGDLPQLTGKPQSAGHVTFAPASITFLAIPNAGNAACR
jgi:heparanase 1